MQMSRRAKTLILQIVMTILVIVWILPIVWVVATSFKTTTEMFMDPLSLVPKEFTWDNYIRAWKLANFSKYLLNTVIYSVVSTAIVLFISSMSGYVLGRYEFPGKKIIFVTILATILMPSRYTFIPIFDLIRKLDLLNKLGGLILVSSGVNALYVMLFSGYFSTVPKSFEEAAIIEGATFPQIFFKIMLPLSKPVIGTVIIFHFVACWNDFFFPLILTLGNPNARTLGVGLYAFYGEFTTDWTGLAAALVISMIPILIVFLMFQKYFMRVMAGGIKG